MLDKKRMMKIKINEDIKLATEKMKNKKYCCYCKHTISFYAFEKDKKICKWCGKYNYKDDKAKFKDVFIKKEKR